jgi:hypothetical protein
MDHRKIHSKEDLVKQETKFMFPTELTAYQLYQTIILLWISIETRLMYPTYSKVNLPTWVVGTPFGNTPHSPAYILKVWPEREPVQFLRPDEFNPGLDRIQESHCA